MTIKKIGVISPRVCKGIEKEVNKKFTEACEKINGAMEVLDTYEQVLKEYEIDIEPELHIQVMLVTADAVFTIKKLEEELVDIKKKIEKHLKKYKDVRKNGTVLMGPVSSRRIKKVERIHLYVGFMEEEVGNLTKIIDNKMKKILEILDKKDK